MRLYFVFSALMFVSCNSQTQKPAEPFIQDDSVNISQDVINEYYKSHSTSNGKSEAIGSVSNGSLKNGKLLPFSGKNFAYFDTTSYLNGRGFVHEKLLLTILQTYRALETTQSERFFRIMECSNEHGGRIFPHRTHQNGLSIDFMTPLLKNDLPFYGLDTLGGTHYLLEFDNSGKSTRDTEIKIDFECIARQLLTLHSVAKEHGMKISKVIFKIELKDELFATTLGNKLRDSGIYFARSLTPAINTLHDDHFHIDFELIDP